MIMAGLDLAPVVLATPSVKALRYHYCEYGHCVVCVSSFVMLSRSDKDKCLSAEQAKLIHRPNIVIPFEQKRETCCFYHNESASLICLIIINYIAFLVLWCQGVAI